MIVLKNLLILFIIVSISKLVADWVESDGGCEKFELKEK